MAPYKPCNALSYYFGTLIYLWINKPFKTLKLPYKLINHGTIQRSMALLGTWIIYTVYNGG